MEKIWYRIDTLEGTKTRTFVGTSELRPEQLVKKLLAVEYLKLSDLSYRDNQNRLVSWATWEPRLAPVVYINPKYVASVMSFIGDPRSDGQTNGPTNTQPE